MFSKLRFSFAGTMVLLASAAMHAATLNVGPGQTYTTIQSAINAATAGDTVLVAPGTYYETIDFLGKSITVTSSAGAATTVIDGNGAPVVVAFHNGETRSAILSGFTIQHAVLPAGTTPFTVVVAGIYTYAGANPTIENNLITNNRGDGIVIKSGGLISQNTIRNTTTEFAPNGDSGCDYDDGVGISISNGNAANISVDVSNNIVENNVGHCHGGGIQIENANNPTIRNNTIRSNQSLGFGGGISISATSSALILQNLILNNLSGASGGGLYLGGGPNVLVANNTIVDNNIVKNPNIQDSYYDGSGAAWVGSFTGFINNIVISNIFVTTSDPGTSTIGCDQPPGMVTQSLNNDILNEAGSSYSSLCKFSTSNGGNISLVPQFLDPTNGDYHLQPGSPAIDAGNNGVLTMLAADGGTLTFDLDGHPRIQNFTGKGCIIDMGVYEYAGSQVACSTTETLDSSLNPSSYGQNVTFTATLSSTNGVPTGYVIFTDGSTTLGSEIVSSAGLSTFTTGQLAIGSHSIAATYQPTGSYFPTTALLNQVVTTYPTTTALTCTPATIAAGADAQMIATVASPFGTPAGVVTFIDNGLGLSTRVLTGGTANLAYLGQVPGRHTITATYIVNGNYASSFATCVIIVVAGPVLSNVLTVTNGALPATNVAVHTPITLTATVDFDYAPLTTGQVAFCDATAPHCTDIHLLGTAQLTSAGTATLRLVPGLGTHSYKAIFLGTHTYVATPSNTATLLVSGVNPTTTVLAATGPPGNYTLTATVTGAGYTQPVGTVSFLDTTNANYLLASAPLGAGSPATTFTNSSNPAAGKAPQAVASADFNNDGIPDLAVANMTDSTVTLLLGNGDGTFTTGATLATGNYPENLAIADLNADGNADIITSNFNGGNLSIFLGKGDGTFSAAPSPSTGGGPSGVSVGDFNNDGIPDLAVGNEFPNTVTILLGKGDGTFTPAPNLSVAVEPLSIAVADFNGDGRADLAVVAYGSNIVDIFLGKGDGTFSAATSLFAGNFPLSVVAADWNSDGIPDLAITLGRAAAPVVFLGVGDGTFTQVAAASTPGSLYAIAAGDFNFDGKPDLAVTDISTGGIDIFPGNNDGTFAAPIAIPNLSASPLSIALADFNEDGSTDLATVNPTNNTVPLVLSTFGTAATATVTGISPVGTGTHDAQASYSGDTFYSPSFSNLVPLIAERVPTTTTLTAAPTSSITGQAVTLIATVSPTLAQNHTLSGSVSFTSNGVPIGSGTVANGSATLSVTTLPAGTDVLQAAYSGDTNFAPSTSAAQQEVVIASTFTIALNPASLTLAAGQAGATTITLTSVGNFAGPLSLTYGSLPAYATATLSPATVSLPAAGTAGATFALNTRLKAANARPAFPADQRPGAGTVPAIVAAGALLLLPLALTRRKRLARILGLLAIAAAFQAVTGCTNAYYIEQTVGPGTYQIPITATDANHNAKTATLTLTITP